MRHNVAICHQVFPSARHPESRHSAGGGRAKAQAWQAVRPWPRPWWSRACAWARSWARRRRPRPALIQTRPDGHAPAGLAPRRAGPALPVPSPSATRGDPCCNLSPPPPPLLTAIFGPKPRSAQPAPARRRRDVARCPAPRRALPALAPASPISRVQFPPGRRPRPAGAAFHPTPPPSPGPAVLPGSLCRPRLLHETAEGAILDTQRGTFEGWLLARGGGVEDTRPRWFVDGPPGDS